MASKAPEGEALSPIKRALLEIRQLRAELERTREASREPIAIVGMGLRLPGGVRDAEGFARLLWSATDAIGEIPASRWRLDDFYDPDPDAPGKMVTRYGAFLDDVDRFDAHFFGIAPREADSMDPQQRLLLEVTWQALEDAGCAPASLAGSRTGVYLGIANSDYGRALFARPDTIDAYVATGNAFSVAAGRLSYFLGLQGPSISIDTACSSSLVALHLACQGLRLREADRAVVGGVNLVLTPEMNINFSRARMMAADGRCKTFDADADGYVRGEGCVVVVLRRLSDALADGDRVLAVVRGSAVNQDGRSGGLTAPNGPAQEAVLRAALDAAGVSGVDIGFVEAHGTGTSLGDPIEVGALSAVLCANRESTRPLTIGSVKTNLGHLEAAAGLAGLAKVVLALGREEIPPNLHFHRGNPLIDWSGPIAVPTAATPWPAAGGRRLAGVSSFGFSGTNAHAILEQAPIGTAAPAASDPSSKARPLHLLTLSARDPSALDDLAAAYADRLRAMSTATSTTRELADVCFTASAGRSHFEYRTAVVGTAAADMARALDARRRGEADPAVASGTVEGNARPQVAFLFTGHGAQRAGMGRGLYESSPVVRAILDTCDAALTDVLPRRLLDVTFASSGGATPLDESLYAQPATFAIEVALAALWRSWGIEPSAVLGHSLGEYAAACAAGLFSVEDGIRLVAERGRLTDALPAGGAMGTVFAGAEAVEAELALHVGRAWIAGFNGPEHTVVSGERPSVEQVLATFERRGVRVKMLRVPYASHTPMVERELPALRRALEQVRWARPRTVIVSNVTGAVAGFEEVARTEYWLTHMRQPVRFAQSMQALAAQGIRHFVEIGPHPVLLGIGADCVGGENEWLPSLHRDRPDWTDLLESLQRLYVGGAEIDWAGFHRGEARRRVGLPAYPFRRRRHWSADLERGPRETVTAPERFARVAAAVAGESERGPLDLNVASYPHKWALLERLTYATAASVLREAGVFVATGEAHSLEEVMARAGIRASYRHLVKRWLEGLVSLGVLRLDGERYVATGPLPHSGVSWDEAQAAFSDNAPLLAYFRHCCGIAGKIIAGKESPLETLFPGGSFALAEGLYEHSATMRYINALAASALAALAATTPSGRPLRVLEIGAGTGSTTASLLAALPADKRRYVFSDVSDVFLERGRERFTARGAIDFRRFDVDRDPDAQGFAPASFDVVVAANAVHASVDLRLALRRIRELLAPGGFVVLVESTNHMAWFDVTTGLIEGWQHFADDLRTDNPLLAPDVWEGALRAAGFEEAGAWPARGSAAEALGQHVLVARAPGEVVATVSDRADTAQTTSEISAAAVPATAADPSVRDRVLAALPSERQAILRDFIRGRVMAILRLDESRPPGNSDRLMDLGFDSLMAVQLRNSLSKSLGFERPLPATTMFDYPTIEALSRRLGDLIAPEAPAGAPAPQGEAPAPILGAAAVAAMSDDEIEAALLKRLERR